MKRKRIFSLILLSPLLWLFNQSILSIYFPNKLDLKENIVFKISGNQTLQFTQNLAIDKKEEKSSKYYNHINFQIKNDTEWNIFLYFSIKDLNSLKNFLMEQKNYSSSILSIKDFLQNQNFIYLIDSYGNQLDFIDCSLKKSHIINNDEDADIHEYNYKMSIQNSFLYDQNQNISINYLYTDYLSEYTSFVFTFPFSLQDLYLTYVPTFGLISSHFQLSLNNISKKRKTTFSSTTLSLSDNSVQPEMINVYEENFDENMILNFDDLSKNSINSYQKVPIISIFSNKFKKNYLDGSNEQKIGDLFFTPSDDWIEIYFSNLEILWFDGHKSSDEECEKLFQTDFFGFTAQLSFDYWYRDNYETNWTNGNIDEKESYKPIEFKEIYNNNEKIIGYKIRVQKWIPSLTWYEGTNFYYYRDYTHTYLFDWSIVKNGKKIGVISSFKAIFTCQSDNTTI